MTQSQGIWRRRWKRDEVPRGHRLVLVDVYPAVGGFQSVETQWTKGGSPCRAAYALITGENPMAKISCLMKTASLRSESPDLHARRMPVSLLQ